MNAVDRLDASIAADREARGVSTVGRSGVVGLDLSLTQTGLAHERGELVIKPRTTGMARLDEISKRVAEYCGGADLVVIEGYSYGSKGSAVFNIGELGGVVRYMLWTAGVPYVDVPPSTLKKYATGKGNVGKDEMLAAAIRRLGYSGANNNEADALWLRAMGLDHRGDPLTVMPEANRASLEKVEWPS